MSPTITRRRLLAGIAGTVGLAGTAGAAAWSGGVFDSRLVTSNADIVARTEEARRRAGAATITAKLNPRPVTVDLGGPRVQTWGTPTTRPAR